MCSDCWSLGWWRTPRALLLLIWEFFTRARSRGDFMCAVENSWNVRVTRHINASECVWPHPHLAKWKIPHLLRNWIDAKLVTCVRMVRWLNNVFRLPCRIFADCTPARVAFDMHAKHMNVVYTTRSGCVRQHVFWFFRGRGAPSRETRTAWSALCKIWQ